MTAAFVYTYCCSGQVENCRCVENWNWNKCELKFIHEQHQILRNTEAWKILKIWKAWMPEILRKLKHTTLMVFMKTSRTGWRVRIPVVSKTQAVLHYIYDSLPAQNSARMKNRLRKTRLQLWNTPIVSHGWREDTSPGMIFGADFVQNMP